LILCHLRLVLLAQMSKRKPKKKPNPIARALNLVTKPVTMVDKKKLMSKMKCRQKLNLNEGE